MPSSHASADLTHHQLEDPEYASVRYLTPPSDDEPYVQVLYSMPPCTELSFRQELTTLCAYTANPAMIFSSRVNFDFVNVDAPHSVPTSEWPAYGITLWFSRLPRDAYPSKKEKKYWSKSMVRILSSAMESSMPLPPVSYTHLTLPTIYSV